MIIMRDKRNETYLSLINSLHLVRLGQLICKSWKIKNMFLQMMHAGYEKWSRLWEIESKWLLDTW